MDWHVESSPHDYKGAYLLHMVVGMPRYFIGDKDVAVLHDTSSATQAPIITDRFDSFALRFGYHQEDTLFHVDYASGITAAGPPPTSEEAGEKLLVWDFRDCAPDVVSRWQVREASGSCEPGARGGVILRENKGDAQLIGPAVDIPVAATGARYMRIRVSVRYPARAVDVPFMSRWYWKGPGEDWSKERRQRLEIKEDGVPHIYWTFVPASEAGEVVDGLRFDPSNGTAAAIQWIALDLVK
jgi:hypothetical protein